MKAQQSTKFEASWSLWTRPLWYFGSVSRKTSWDSEMSKCKTVRKKKMSETIYSHSSLKMTLSVIQYQNYFTHQRSMKSFQLEWHHWYRALECAHCASSLLILCFKSGLWPWNFIGSTKKFFNKAKLMVLHCWEKEMYLFWSFYLLRDKTKTSEKDANLKLQIFYVDKWKVTVCS